MEFLDHFVKLPGSHNKKTKMHPTHLFQHVTGIFRFLDLRLIRWRIALICLGIFAIIDFSSSWFADQNRINWGLSSIIAPFGIAISPLAMNLVSLRTSP